MDILLLLNLCDGGGLIDIRRNMLHVNGSAQLHSAEPTDSGERFSIAWFPIGSTCLAKMNDDVADALRAPELLPYGVVRQRRAVAVLPGGRSSKGAMTNTENQKYF